MVTEPGCSTSLMPKSAIGHDPEPVSFTSHPQPVSLRYILMLPSHLPDLWSGHFPRVLRTAEWNTNSDAVACWSRNQSGRSAKKTRFEITTVSAASSPRSSVQGCKPSLLNLILISLRPFRFLFREKQAQYHVDGIVKWAVLRVFHSLRGNCSSAQLRYRTNSSV
jgi:hypothetical protein